MPRTAGGWKLAYTFLFWFLLVSLIPIGVTGYYLIDISRTALKDQTLRNQESFAVGFANTVWNYIATYKGVLLEPARSDDFTAGINPQNVDRQNQVLNLIMQTHAAFMELSVFDNSGEEVVRKGRFLGPKPPPMRNFSDQPAFQLAMQGTEYMGSLERFQGLYPTLTLAVPIWDPKTQGAQGAKPLGVLMGRLSLNGLSQMLNQEFPPEAGQREAAVVGGDMDHPFLVADSSLTLIFRPDPRLPKEVTDSILTQTQEKGGGEISLGDGKTRLLIAFAAVRKELGWVVYVSEPLESEYQAVQEMMGRTFKVLSWVMLVTLVLAWVVSRHITEPIRILREAAERLGKGQFEEMPEMVMSSDELGDLAQTFQEMGDSLREKTGEIVRAKDELEKFNKFLDNRVKARERELKAAQDELITKERLAAIGQMASVVGHEIRNPLAVINNSTYFIKTKLGSDGAVTDPKIAKHIAIIESEIKQANGIINEILTFSRSRALNPVVMSINNFLEEILSVHPFPSHIQVVRHFTQSDPIVNIDADEMRQAVRNLIGNAVEVMPQGGTLKIGTEMVEEEWVRIDIADTGPGIPPDILEKIFAPFFTTKARGTGLGLAVVRKVVDRHRGKVDVDSAVGSGTTFKIFLPVAAKTAPPAPDAAARVRPGGGAPGA